MGKLKLHLLSAIPFSAGILKNFLETNDLFIISRYSHTIEAAIQDLSNEHPDVLIIDDSFLKRSEVVDLVNVLPGNIGNGKSLIYTGSTDPHYFKRLIEHGACGIFHKRSPAEKIIEAIKLVSIGSVYIDSHVNFSIFQNDIIHELQEDIISGPLNKREKEILELIYKGFKNKQIARKLLLSVKTIENYKEKIKDKLGRTEEGYVAFDDRCSHRGGSLANGVMICNTVQCLWHGSQFNVKTGAVKSGPAEKEISTYKIETKADGIYLSPLS